MIWWGWNKTQRVFLYLAILAIAALPLLWLGKAVLNWKAVIGVWAFSAIPLMTAWQLFVGFTTGFIPFRGKVSRAADPITFWCIAGACAGLLAVYIGMIAWVIIRARNG